MRSLLALSALLLAIPLAAQDRHHAGAAPATGAADDGPVIAFTLDLGVNSLAGIGGLAFSNYFAPRWALDAGAGFGLNKWKFGLRARYFFYENGPLHLFGGLAQKYATGWGDHDLSMSLAVNGKPYNFFARIDPSWFTDAVMGGELRFGHFLLTPAFGWSQLLGGRNWTRTGGDELDGKARSAMDFIEGSGPSASLQIGFTL